jgi:hypothetical protein
MHIDMTGGRDDCTLILTGVICAQVTSFLQFSHVLRSRDSRSRKPTHVARAKLNSEFCAKNVPRICQEYAKILPRPDFALKRSQFLPCSSKITFFARIPSCGSQ